nr:MAG TPA: hypothetical protein [Caudoviricetes sp.]DAX05676.1 MAG TPA: hypothetical protein [Bacteriophage sp.]
MTRFFYFSTNFYYQVCYYIRSKGENYEKYE